MNESEPIHTARIEEPPTQHWIGLRDTLVRPFQGWLGGWFRSLADGWPHDITDDELLERLLALNLQRAGV